MAASDARPVPKKNVAFRLYLAIRKNDGTLITSWTGQDTELSLDGGAFADATNEATEIGTSGVGYIDLTSSETNYDSVVVKTTVTNASALPFVAVLYPEETGDIRADATAISGDSTAADNLETACDGGSYNVGGGSVVAASVTGAVGSVTGNVGGNVTGSVGSVAAGGITAESIGTNAIDADSLAADAVTEIQAGLALQASVDDLESRLSATRAGYLDNLTNLDAAISTRAAATTALSNLVWTDAKAGYLTGAVALEATLTAIKGAGWSTETLAAIDALIDAIKAKTDLIPASPAAVGSAMTLADDAITAAKFDESTAYPLTSADTGATAVARTGADADTLETLSDQMDGVGAGADPLRNEVPGDYAVGTAGYAISVAGGAADPLLNEVPGTYAVGTAGEALGFIEAIKLKTDLIVSDGTTTIAAPVNGDDITIHRGDTLVATFEGLGSLVGRTALYWSVKRRAEESDDDALLCVEETAGLLRLNGAAVEDETLGSIVVTDESAGDITITLLPEVTVELAPATRLVWDLQLITATAVTTLAQGSAVITADVTRAIGAPGD